MPIKPRHSIEELEQRALVRAKAERLRIVKLAGQDRYLARSRTVEPGAYYELSVSPWGYVRCSCPGFIHSSICKHSVALKAKLQAQSKTSEVLPGPRRSLVSGQSQTSPDSPLPGT
jgi:hypothetical protein